MTTDKIKDMQYHVNKLNDLILQIPDNVQLQYTIKLLEAQISEIATNRERR